jgi:hypothetical protein
VPARRLATFVFGCVAFVGSLSAVAADVGPDLTEQIFWQSAEGLATPDAYRAYLSRYPSGFFTPLANAALSKAAGLGKSEGRPPRKEGGSLNNFTSSTASGAVSFNIGEAFSGPTAVGVGWLGAKKKLVLPAGKWIALAAQDEIANLPSSNAGWTQTHRLTLSTVSFGRFSNGRLVSLMTFKFSAQKAPAINWSGLDGCERPGTVVLQSIRPAKSGWTDECMAMAFDPRPLNDGSPATAELQKSLVRLGAMASGSALVSTWSYSQRQRGLLSIARYDGPGPMLDNESQSARDWSPENQIGDRPAYASRLWKWAQGYRPFASSGFGNDYADDGKGPVDFAAVTSK